jgi:hypothetical protein
MAISNADGLQEYFPPEMSLRALEGRSNLPATVNLAFSIEAPLPHHAGDRHGASRLAMTMPKNGRHKIHPYMFRT